MDPEELEPRKKLAYEIGADLSQLSVAELKALAERLRDEIARIEAAVKAKESSRSAADSIFKS